MNRREYLKGTAALVAAATLPGCDNSGGTGASRYLSGSRNGVPTSEHELFDRGEVPIGLSGWTRPHGTAPSYAPLQADLDTDVLVIGAGLAGSSLALHLAEAGIGVAVLEARQPGWGASGRNAGHVLPILKDPALFQHLPDEGRAFLELFAANNAMVFDIARKYGIDCDATPSGYLTVTRDKSAFDTLSKEAEFWENSFGYEIERVGESGVKELTGSDRYDFGVWYRAGGLINPYLFTNGMISGAADHGATIFGDSEAVSIAQHGNRWHVRTAQGSVTADRVVFCTNAYPTEIAPEFTRAFYPLTIYALSTQPLPESLQKVVLPSRAALAQAPYELNPFIVDGSNRIITSLIPSPCKPEDGLWHFQQHLNWIHRVWPDTKDTEIRLETYWTGRVAMRDQEFPGVFQLRPGIYGLMYFNGWGNLMAPFMGRLLADGLYHDDFEKLPFPLTVPPVIENQNDQDLKVRKFLIPLARIRQKFGLV